MNYILTVLLCPAKVENIEMAQTYVHTKPATKAIFSSTGTLYII